MRVSEAFLEITEPGADCDSRCAISYRVRDCIMPREGVFARVLRGGRVCVRDAVGMMARGEEQR